MFRAMPQVRTSGLTGAIEFDREGFRTEFSLDIVELLKDGLTKVGYWTLASGANYTRSYGEKIREIEHSLWNKTLKVIMALVSAARPGWPECISVLRDGACARVSNHVANQA